MHKSTRDRDHVASKIPRPQRLVGRAVEEGADQQGVSDPVLADPERGLGEVLYLLEAQVGDVAADLVGEADLRS